MRILRGFQIEIPEDYPFSPALTLSTSTDVKETSMKKYILRRFLLSLIVLFGVILIIFTITRVVPSDPAAKWAGARATAEQVEAARIELGLDKPVPVHINTKRALHLKLNGEIFWGLNNSNSLGNLHDTSLQEICFSKLGLSESVK